MAGGYDKQIDLSQMADAIAKKTKAVALMGETAEHLSLLIEERTNGRAVSLEECDSFKNAFDWACSQSSPGDVVLLSPGCASYDWFENFAKRGDAFIHLIESLDDESFANP